MYLQNPFCADLFGFLKSARRLLDSLSSFLPSISKCIIVVNCTSKMYTGQTYDLEKLFKIHVELVLPLSQIVRNFTDNKKLPYFMVQFRLSLLFGGLLANSPVDHVCFLLKVFQINQRLRSMQHAVAMSSLSVLAIVGTTQARIFAACIAVQMPIRNFLR